MERENKSEAGPEDEATESELQNLKIAQQVNINKKRVADHFEDLQRCYFDFSLSCKLIWTKVTTASILMMLTNSCLTLPLFATSICETGICTLKLLLDSIQIHKIFTVRARQHAALWRYLQHIFDCILY